MQFRSLSVQCSNFPYIYLLICTAVVKEAHKRKKEPTINDKCMYRPVQTFESGLTCTAPNKRQKGLNITKNELYGVLQETSAPAPGP